MTVAMAGVTSSPCAENLGAVKKMSYDCHSPGPREAFTRGRVLSVQRGGLAVRIADVVEAVQHLKFEHAGHKDAAVASTLTVPFHLAWRRELNVQLNVRVLRLWFE